MNTAKDWYEMCLVKKKLNDTIDKIDDMFIEISDGCEFRNMYVGVRRCKNEDHIDSGNEYNKASCNLEDCPIIQDGVRKLNK